MIFVHYTLQYTLLRLLMLLITYFKLALLACPLLLSIVLYWLLLYCRKQGQAFQLCDGPLTLTWPQSPTSVGDHMFLAILVHLSKDIPDSI